MANQTCCSVCGAELERESFGNRCPRCVLRLALDMAAANAAPAEARDAGQAPSELPGHLKHFGDYELIEEIARGGMGIVYKARQVTLGRLVAVKMILSGALAGPTLIERFRLEAAAAARLQHPSIVAVHEVGQHEGQHYFSMDYVAGPDLTACVGTTPLAAKRAARYAQRIAEAISYAHGQGVLHRDLKPSNVLIDSNDQPRVTDFGLAKRLTDSPRSTLHSPITVSGQVMGTPGYLPPEQASGSRQAIGPASDVYGLGAVLYFLLTARPPFMGETIETTLSQVLHQDPVSPRLLNPSVPRDLETVCLKCLEKEPRRRYASAQDLTDELGRFLEGRPILARPVGTASKLGRWCRRKPLMAGLSAGLLMTLVLGFAGMTWQWQQTERERWNQRRLAYVASMRAAHLALEENHPRLAASLLQQQRPSAGEKHDLRGIEWRYLWQRSRGDEVRSFVHPSGLKDIALSPDGHHLATLAYDDRVRVWDASTGELVKEYAGQSFQSIRKSLAFSRDGRSLILPVPAGIAVIGTTDWTRRLLLEGASAPLCLSADGTRLVAVDRTNLMVQVWSLPSLTSTVLTNSEAHYYNLALNADGTLIAFSSANPFWGFCGQVTLWNVGTERREVVQDQSDSVCLAISPDGQWLVSGHFSGELCWWRLADRRLVVRFRAHSGSIFALGFSPDSKILATGGTEELICLWEPGTTNRLESWADVGTITGLAFSEDGQKLASASYGRTAKLWDLNRRRGAGHTFRIPDSLRVIGSLPDGSALVGSDLSGHTHCLWRLPDGVLIRSNTWNEATLHGCPGAKCFPAHRLAIGVDGTGTVHLWDLVTQTHRRSVPLAGAAFEPTGLSPDGRWLLGYRPDDSGVLCDLATGVTMRRFPRVKYYSYPAAFSPDGRRLAYAATNYTIRIWDLETQREALILPGHELMVTALRFSPDGSVLASGGADGEFKLWSVITGGILVPTVRTHQGMVRQLAFSPDGRTVVSSDTGLTVHWWNLANGREMLVTREQTLAGGSEYLAMESYYGAHADLNPGGKWLVWQGRQGLIEVSPLPSLAEIDQIEKDAPR